MIHNFPLSAFTSLSGNDVRARVLRSAIESAIPAHALRPGRLGARFIDDKEDPTFQFYFTGELDDDQKTALDAIVASHTGPATDPDAGLGRSVKDHRFIWDPNSADKRYLSWVDKAAQTGLDNDRVRNFFPGNYKLMQIVCWSVGSQAPGSTQITLHVDGSPAMSVQSTVVMGDTRRPYRFNFARKPGDVLFGQHATLGVQPTNDPDGEMIADTFWKRTR